MEEKKQVETPQTKEAKKPQQKRKPQHNNGNKKQTPPKDKDGNVNPSVKEDKDGNKNPNNKKPQQRKNRQKFQSAKNKPSALEGNEKWQNDMRKTIEANQKMHKIDFKNLPN